MPDQPVTVHKKLIAFGFATEDRMIVEHKASLAFATLALKNQSRRQPADPATHDHAIVSFPGIDGSSGQTFKQSIANLVPGLEDGGRVAVGVRVVADPAIADPVDLVQEPAPPRPAVPRAMPKSRSELPEASRVAFRKSRREMAESAPSALSAPNIATRGVTSLFEGVLIFLGIVGVQNLRQGNHRPAL